MREIKFRAWDGRQMRKGFRVEVGVVIVNERAAWVYLQYTGLKDKDGTEIYEGDILEVENYPKRQLVEYRPQTGMWKTGVEPAAAKVVGNIYQSPGLLK